MIVVQVAAIAAVLTEVVAVLALCVLLLAAVVLTVSVVVMFHRDRSAVWPLVAQIRWAWLGGASAAFTIAGSVSSEFVLAHVDLMKATFDAVGAVPSVAAVFGGRIFGAVMLAAAVLVLIPGVKLTAGALRSAAPAVRAAARR